MSKILTTLAVLMLAVTATASAAPAQDFSSPDARPAIVNQDLRSPDAHPVAAQQVAQDLRSPDARSAWQRTSTPVASTGSTSGFNWAYLAILVTIPLLLIGGFLVTLRRGRDTVAIGG